METTIKLEEGGIQGMKHLQESIYGMFSIEVAGSLAQGLAYYAQIKTLQRAAEAAIKEMDKTLIPFFVGQGNVSEQTKVGNHLFLVQDKPSYNYEGNDDDGLWRLKQQQIDSLMSEKKVLTIEQGAIEDRIRLEHPNMRVEHHYTLLYKGNVTEVESGNR